MESFAFVLLQLLQPYLTHLHPSSAETPGAPWPSQQCEQSTSNPTWSNLDRKPLQIVDFGSGSGNLVMTLAYLFPCCEFIAVDMRETSIRLLNQRAAAAGLHNVRGELGRIESFEGKRITTTMQDT